MSTRIPVFSLMFTLVAVLVGTASAQTKTPFNGKNLDGWKTKEPAKRSQWKVGTAKLVPNHPDVIAFEDEGNQLVNTGTDVNKDAEQIFVKFSYLFQL